MSQWDLRVLKKSRIGESPISCDEESVMWMVLMAGALGFLLDQNP